VSVWQPAKGQAWRDVLDDPHYMERRAVEDDEHKRAYGLLGWRRNRKNAADLIGFRRDRREAVSFC
jgi:hypothetical protein